MLLGLMSMILESVALRAGECIMSISGWRVQAISANLPAWNLLSVSTKMTGPSNLSNAGGRFISHVFFEERLFFDRCVAHACMVLTPCMRRGPPPGVRSGSKAGSSQRRQAQPRRVHGAKCEDRSQLVTRGGAGRRLDSIDIVREKISKWKASHTGWDVPLAAVPSAHQFCYPSCWQASTQTVVQRLKIGHTE